MEIKEEAASFALKSIDDGWILEEFALKILTAKFIYEFMPAGGVKDRGIDGLEHSFERTGYSRQIFQISTEKDTEFKIDKTYKTLADNKIKFDVLTYVTNRFVKNKDKLMNDFYDKNQKQLKIYDLPWLIASIYHNESTRQAFVTLIDSHFHEFNKPGKSFVVSNIENDSRLFVFLRQQLDSKSSKFKIDELLAESLIMFALEGTDPNNGIFLSEEQILNSIRTYVRFDPRMLHETISKRLSQLSKKPRKIQFHAKNKTYCLPYETRVEITQRNLSDKELEATFFQQTEDTLKKFLKENLISVRDVAVLVNEVIQKIFYNQGLEFSNFVLHGKNQETVEKDLQGTIAGVVDESSVVLKNKQIVKTGLLMALRDIIYNGTLEQRKYLKSLSNTYMMMFMLQWNPQIAMYFEKMSTKLKVYVCTSIIIPALSEYYLNEQNRRHWGLLKASKASGIALIVSDAIVDELVHHFRMIKNKYESQFRHDESVYLTDELQQLYIDEILIRAYFHAKTRGSVYTFYDFINNFCDPGMLNPKQELIDYLKHEFGITYITDESNNVKINQHEEEILTAKLEEKKTSNKARTDAKIILTIYQLRQKNNEAANGGIFGFRTWWLSKDTSTYWAVQDILNHKYSMSCYMRPDFLYNYIALAPKRSEVDMMYKEIFPSLLGVNLSFHLPKEVTEYVQQIIHEHSTKNPARIKAIIAQLTHHLQSDPRNRSRKNVKHFLDEQLKTIIN
ncbi:hypothetical protein [Terrimonas ferruginea]|uniref:hypothetical protein n=1 Tax=Terrimonas ferruginea TaxID=249 RepID=UPI00040F3916|nr:hypothetical protein [Terrimonas ferruginea]